MCFPYTCAHDKGKGRYFEVGGVATLATSIEILSNSSPDSLVLATGNTFYGSLEGFQGDGEEAAKAIAQLNLDYISIGARDFKYGPISPFKTIPARDDPPQESLKINLELAQTPVVTGNIINSQTANKPAWPNSTSYALKEVNGIKIGIVSSFSKKHLDNIIPHHLNGLYLQNPIDAPTRQVKLLRRKGANLIVLMAHFTGSCGKDFSQKNSIPIEKTNFDPSNTKICNTNLGHIKQNGAATS